jgi:hypothetical protein
MGSEASNGGLGDAADDQDQHRQRSWRVYRCRSKLKSVGAMGLQRHCLYRRPLYSRKFAISEEKRHWIARIQW